MQRASLCMNTKRLKKIHLFSTLQEAELERVNARIKWIEYDERFAVLSHHERSTEVYFIAEGAVKITTYTSAGKEIAFQNLGLGSMFGEVACLDNKPRTATAITLKPCLIARLGGEDFRWLINTYPAIQDVVMRRMCEMVRSLCDRVYEYSALGVSARIRSEILRIASANTTSANAGEVPQFVTHEDIASRVSTHREAVTKEVGAMNRAGLVIKQGRTLNVPDIEALSAAIRERVNIKKTS